MEQVLPLALHPEPGLASAHSLLQHPGQVRHSDIGMSAVPLYLRCWGQSPCFLCSWMNHGTLQKP